jgi:LmbE family N-acetylglucosaminyl deacetylase
MPRRLAFLLLALLAAVSAQARTASELQLAVRKLNVLGSALYVAAHPDDENTAMLAWLANDKLLRTSYLSVTRGDGGQNLIGDEKGPLLGVIRTHELLAARRIDRAEQYFTRAIDFGYTKSAEETLQIWDHQAVLADVVWIIRKLQPDVIVTRFPVTGEGGHGQHTASAMLAEEAFNAAGDPTKFPEQLRAVTVWQPKRLVWNRFSRGPVDPNDPALAGATRIDLGTYNPLLGRAYTEIAAESRSQHKSQGFGSAERRGSILNYFVPRLGAAAEKDLFEGIDTSWSRYKGGEAVGKILQQAADSFDPKNPAASIPLLLDAYDQMSRLGAMPEWDKRGNPWIHHKMIELTGVIRDCAGIAIDVAAASPTVVAGAEIPVSVTVVNRSDYPFSLSTVASLYANPGKAPGVKLENNKPVKTDITIKLPADFPMSQPYWLAEGPTMGMYKVDDLALIGLAENPPAIPIHITLEDNRMHWLQFTVPAVFRWTDAVRGEITRNVDVVPEVTANLGSGLYIFPDEGPRNVTVWLRNFSGVDLASLRLLVPGSWTAEPVSRSVIFKGAGDEQRFTFKVTPPSKEFLTRYKIKLPSEEQHFMAEVELKSGTKIRVGLTELDYEHITPQRVFGDAAAKVVRVDIARRGDRIGYVMGAGDDVPGILRQIGYTVDLLSDDDLERADLSKFDAIVTGIRAYNTRKRLVHAQARLMKYVENGGTLVVQMNSLSPQPLLTQELGPYPLKVSNERVTVEDSPVTVLTPTHPLLNAPNKIVADDFKGWIQERGLYFPNEWDPKYETAIATTDPGEKEKRGGILYAKHGKGVFIYSALAWFRQLPAGVPGALKLFTNMVSARGTAK